MTASGTPRILLGATYSAIEPLGLLHLAGLARDLGWDAHIRLVENDDYAEFEAAVRDIRPTVVGFTIYTGNHLPLYACFDRLRARHPEVRRVIGGPHATYFPRETASHADHVVVSEGFDALDRILRDQAPAGILHPRRLMRFPLPDRRRFYADYPGHRRNPIKNIISTTGCPYTCTYCYNSSKTEDTIAPSMSREQLVDLERVLGRSGRLFPRNERTVEDVLTELRACLDLAPETRLLYWQDDIIGANLGFLRELATRAPLGVASHGQMRFEMADPARPGSHERIDLLRRIGFTGLTLAIESADEHLRREVLDRAMPESLMFEAMQGMKRAGFAIRTEQITGLPTGATRVQTAMNLDADLDLLELNLRLRNATASPGNRWEGAPDGGLPDVSWASTLVPYLGTPMGEYCIRHGFVTESQAANPNHFNERAVLRYLRAWVGPSLAERAGDPDLWLDGPDLERYRSQNAHLRLNFHVFAYLSALPGAMAFVRGHLTEGAEFTPAGTSRALCAFVRAGTDSASLRLQARLAEFDARVLPEVGRTPAERAALENVRGYCVVLPGDMSEIARRCLRYDATMDMQRLGTVLRRHLFDAVLYRTGESTSERYTRGTPEVCGP